jgi:hypothetical protein
VLFATLNRDGTIKVNKERLTDKLQINVTEIFDIQNVKERDYKI